MCSDDTHTLFGALNQNLFLIAGANECADVKTSTLQYFWFYNFNFSPKWGIGAAPIIAWEWERTTCLFPRS